MKKRIVLLTALTLVGSISLASCTTDNNEKPEPPVQETSLLKDTLNSLASAYSYRADAQTTIAEKNIRGYSSSSSGYGSWFIKDSGVIENVIFDGSDGSLMLNEGFLDTSSQGVMKYQTDGVTLYPGKIVDKESNVALSSRVPFRGYERVSLPSTLEGESYTFNFDYKTDTALANQFLSFLELSVSELSKNILTAELYVSEDGELDFLATYGEDTIDVVIADIDEDVTPSYVTEFLDGDETPAELESELVTLTTYPGKSFIAKARLSSNTVEDTVYVNLDSSSPYAYFVFNGVDENNQKLGNQALVVINGVEGIDDNLYVVNFDATTGKPLYDLSDPAAFMENSMVFEDPTAYSYMISQGYTPVDVLENAIATYYLIIGLDYFEFAFDPAGFDLLGAYQGYTYYDTFDPVLLNQSSQAIATFIGQSYTFETIQLGFSSTTDALQIVFFTDIVNSYGLALTYSDFGNVDAVTVDAMTDFFGSLA